MDRVLDCQFHRRFGVEIELNTLNGIVVKLDEEEGQIPYGSDKVACIIRKAIDRPVEVKGWHPTHNNDMWVVKPDSSCGIEVCSPVLKGWTGLKSVMKVSKALSDNNIPADNRCSLHVHVNIADLTKRQLATVMAYYIKCEHLIFDSLPEHRKDSKYCQFIGTTDLFSVDFDMDLDEIIYRVSAFKYYSINAYHFMKGGGFTLKNNRRQSMEFRVAGAEACLDPFYIKNWVRFLIHFVEMTKNLPYPEPYQPGDDQWSGLLWLNYEDMFKILGFNEPMSDGLKQVKDWFISRSLKHGYDAGENSHSIFSNNGRSAARKEILNIVKTGSIQADCVNFCEDLLFGKKYVK